MVGSALDPAQVDLRGIDSSHATLLPSSNCLFRSARRITPPVVPSLDLSKNRSKVRPAFGKRVQRTRVMGCRNEPGFLKFLEPLCQQPVGESRNCGRDLPESTASREQCAEDGSSPTFAHQFGRGLKIGTVRAGGKSGLKAGSRIHKLILGYLE